MEAGTCSHSRPRWPATREPGMVPARRGVMSVVALPCRTDAARLAPRPQGGYCTITSRSS